MPVIYLKGRNVIKFKATRRRYERLLKSAMNCGIALWDRFS